MPDLEKIFEFLSGERGARLSPVVRTQLVLALVEVTAVLDATNDLFIFGVYGSAAQELIQLRTPMAIDFCYKMFQHSIKAGDVDGLSTNQLRHLPRVRNIGMDALHKAAQLCGLFYGQEHRASIRFREVAEAAAVRASTV